MSGQDSIDCVLQFLRSNFIEQTNIVSLSKDLYDLIFDTCALVAQSDFELKLKFYHLLLVARYKCEDLGPANQFEKLQQQFYKLCPEECSQIEEYLQRKFVPEAIPSARLGG